jgi:hypothetical protein
MISFACTICALTMTAAISEVKVSLHNQHDDSSVKVLDYIIDKYSYSQGIHDFYHAHAKGLLTIMILGGAFMPLARHVILSYCFFKPMNQYTRVRILRAFNSMGRLAFSNIFLPSFNQLVMYHQLHWEITRQLQVQAEVSCSPARAAALGMISLFLITGLNTYLLVLEEQIWIKMNVSSVLTPLLSNSASGGGQSSEYDNNNNSKRQRLLFTLSPTNRIMILLPFIVCVGCFSIMTFSEKGIISFRLDKGLVGTIVSSQQPEWTNIGALSIPTTLPADTEQVIGSAALAFVYVLVVFLFPFTILMCCGLLVFGNFTSMDQRKILQIILCIEPFCALNILAISCISAYKEFHLVVGFTFDQRYPQFCASVKETLGMPCVEIASEIHWIGLGALIATSITFYLVSEMLINTIKSSKEVYDLGLGYHYWIPNIVMRKRNNNR